MAIFRLHRAQFKLVSPIAQQTAEHILFGFDVEAGVYCGMCGR